MAEETKDSAPTDLTAAEDKNRQGSAPSHRVRLVIDQGAYPHIECPYDPADESRPCWPHDESGEPLSVEQATKDGCVYVDWLDNDGIDAFANPITLTFELASATWSGDGFDFEFGEQVPNA